MIANYKGRPTHLLVLTHIGTYRDGGTIGIDIRMKLPDSDIFEDKVLCVDSSVFGGGDPGRRRTGRMYWGNPSDGALVDDPEFELAVLRMVSDYMKNYSNIYKRLKRDYKSK